ncbi:MAG TPA: STAS domain-containing protein [Solirubrobacteraceae bacterium]|nr:STAS domain-containing protein [Solirubrobacteraceae bacterium]
MHTTADTPDSGSFAGASFALERRDLDERVSVISVTGELDLTTAPQLKWALVDALEEGHTHLVVDLSPTSFLDSTALGVLVAVNRGLDARDRLTIVCAKPRLLKIFELSGLDGAFTMRATVDEALASTQPRAARAG